MPTAWDPCPGNVNAAVIGAPWLAEPRQDRAANLRRARAVVPDHAPKGAVDTDRGRNVKSRGAVWPAASWGHRTLEAQPTKPRPRRLQARRWQNVYAVRNFATAFKRPSIPPA
ncbi:hypothetical protein GCM10007857_53770 [Bradyrhizobium iriomotense]|uniref:Transposase DDE domain-containing protein n=1 Tax=Bradyrhizobium iriomotense TaxID=441950 RepID=A0ABQ6B2L1_9BRAD|nr:hypothetical protein GCM10007857_53770 [Bradyrhizobium iriomotense]